MISFTDGLNTKKKQMVGDIENLINNYIMRKKERKVQEIMIRKGKYIISTNIEIMNIESVQPEFL